MKDSQRIFIGLSLVLTVGIAGIFMYVNRDELFSNAEGEPEGESAPPVEPNLEQPPLAPNTQPVTAPATADPYINPYTSPSGQVYPNAVDLNGNVNPAILEQAAQDEQAALAQQQSEEQPDSPPSDGGGSGSGGGGTPPDPTTPTHHHHHHNTEQPINPVNPVNPLGPVSPVSPKSPTPINLPPMVTPTTPQINDPYAPNSENAPEKNTSKTEVANQLKALLTKPTKKESVSTTTGKGFGQLPFLRKGTSNVGHSSLGGTAFSGKKHGSLGLTRRHK